MKVCWLTGTGKLWCNCSSVKSNLNQLHLEQMKVAHWEEVILDLIVFYFHFHNNRVNIMRVKCQCHNVQLALKTMFSAGCLIFTKDIYSIWERKNVSRSQVKCNCSLLPIATASLLQCKHWLTTFCISISIVLEVGIEPVIYLTAACVCESHENVHRTVYYVVK